VLPLPVLGGEDQEIEVFVFGMEKGEKRSRYILNRSL
jgi:hypothetical protein